MVERSSDAEGCLRCGSDSASPRASPVEWGKISAASRRERKPARPGASHPEGPKKPMTFTEAAAEVLRLVGRPLHYKEITDLAIEKNLLSHVGKSPELTMVARLAALLKKTSKDNPLVRVKPGVFALREWDDATIKSGMSEKSAKPTADAVNAAPEEGALEKTPEE